MKIPDKLVYTKAEKTAEICAAAVAAVFTALYIILVCMGVYSGAAIIMAVATAILYGAFTVCSVYPQHTNLASNPETLTEDKLRSLRCQCIAAKILLTAAMFVLGVFCRV
jgi:hypothetical protein